MNLDDLALSDGQGVLVRILRTALSEDEHCAAVLLDALRSADRESLPTEPHEVLTFSRAHLTAPLTKELGPNLTMAFLDDLSAEIDRLRARDNPKSSGSLRAAGASLNVSTPHVVVPVRPPPKSSVSDNEVIARISFPKLRKSVANLVRTASTRIRAAVISASRSPHDGDRATVLLVHSDRVIRASVARALVNARFDVSVFDAAPQLVAALQGRSPPIIAVLDVREKAIESTLRTLVAANPDVSILAWTDVDRTVAEDALAAASVKRFAVLPRAAAEVELVNGARRVLREP